MRLIMVVSSDGYVSRGPTDRMDWTGPEDKRVFKLLTCVGGRLGVSQKTLNLMPVLLGGRVIQPISRDPELGMSLMGFRMTFGKDAWIIGGQTLALAAVEKGIIHEAFICRTRQSVGDGQRLDDRLLIGNLVATVDFDGVSVDVRRIC